MTAGRTNPWHEAGYEIQQCRYCYITLTEDEPSRHAESCVWRRAREATNR